MVDHGIQLDTFLQANLNRYIGEIVQLCAQPSISATKEGLLDCAILRVM